MVLLLRYTTTAFPESQDPFSAGPPIGIEEESSSCKITLFHNASLNTYSTVSRFPYSPTCSSFSNPKPTNWDRVVLKIEGRVSGVQFDRVGSLWFNGVELLRMTTPEPTESGIVWKVERDVTSYATIFREAGEIQLQIPNNINSVYTGVIYMSAQLEFHTLEKNITSSEIGTNEIPIANHVVSLTNPPQHKDAWSNMEISGNQSKIINFTMPTNSAVRAHIDLYASGHGCEEFWYTNPPDSISQQYGMCGGGSTRALQLSIDGKVAGIQPVFPVVYTGGINPLLWRPQTGIYSFNIPPYFFDISPFLAHLNDTKSHEVELKIIGNSIKGQWNVDPVLVVYEESLHDPNTKDGKAGSMDTYRFFQRGPVVIVTNSSAAASSDGNQTTNITWVEEFETEILMETTVAGKPTKVMSKVTSHIENSLIGDSLQVTSASISTSLSSSAYDRAEHMKYPLTVTTDYKDLNHSFLIVADIDLGLKHSISPYPVASAEDTIEASVVYKNRIKSNATYSRSTDPDRTIHIQLGSSDQTTSLSVGNSVCYAQHIEAAQGFVSGFRESRDNCDIPMEFCSAFGTCSPKITNSSRIVQPKASVEVAGNLLLVRHPRSALALDNSEDVLVPLVS